jgi:hypothetical protein
MGTEVIVGSHCCKNVTKGHFCNSAMTLNTIVAFNMNVAFVITLVAVLTLSPVMWHEHH